MVVGYIRSGSSPFMRRHAPQANVALGLRWLIRTVISFFAGMRTRHVWCTSHAWLLIPRARTLGVANTHLLLQCGAGEQRQLLMLAL